MNSEENRQPYARAYKARNLSTMPLDQNQPKVFLARLRNTLLLVIASQRQRPMTVDVETFEGALKSHLATAVKASDMRSQLSMILARPTVFLSKLEFQRWSARRHGHNADRVLCHKHCLSDMRRIAASALCCLLRTHRMPSRDLAEVEDLSFRGGMLMTRAVKLLTLFNSGCQFSLSSSAATQTLAALAGPSLSSESEREPILSESFGELG
ncbi:hypothetical protein G7K_6741-t1 [Saitoella complicata NRRL Y-17804]|uniref:Uncharacterized protein n=1 Tax=Saitoella complicata (strain BCRC 22490 / CBS 7301 / JCM 7358 / NBRC 10748 / NRRL Y-17804) TaxID=698492 RepID=A0A0E9NS18_SAICN|nr:hypothetical protein G7K_6741-t1 [Saitoella complicata NRRL Y-17804]